MTWVATGVGVGGAVMSGVSADKAGKAASRNAASQRQLMERDLNERMRIQRQQESLYGPLEQKMVGYVMNDSIDPIRAGLIRSGIANEYSNADRSIMSLIGTRGVSSGQAASMLQGSALSKARTMANAMLTERQNKDALRMGVLSRYSPYQGGEFASQGLRGLASFYGDEAARARAAEQNGWAGAANGLMGASMIYASRRPAQPPSSPSIPKPTLSGNGISQPMVPPTDMQGIQRPSFAGGGVFESQPMMTFPNTAQRPDFMGGGGVNFGSSWGVLNNGVWR